MGVRKSVNFNVSLEAYEKVKEIFPEVIGTEDNLLQLVTAYKFWCEHKDDAPGADGAEIEKLRADLKQAESERDQKQAEIDRLKQEAENGKNQNKELAKHQEEISRLVEQLMADKEKLEQDLHDAQEGLPSWDAIKRTIAPFPAALLEETAAMLSEYYSREITPMQLMVDMFIRYTIERNAEWFYPFMLKDKNIVAIAQRINPDVTNIDQIKKSLNLD